MGCGVSRSPRVEEAKIKAALTAKPHASAVARVADRWNIALTAGRETMGRHRVSGSRDEAARTNPQATQAEIARVAELAAQLLAISRAGAGIGSGLCYRSAKGFPPPVFRDLGSNGTRPRF